MLKKKVGRPSKKTVRRRKIFKSIKVFSVLGIILFLLFKIFGVDGNNNKLTGNVNNQNGVIRTATFTTTNLDYIEKTKISCQDTGNGCTITLPKFNRKGHYSSYWSIKPITSESLTGQQWSWDYFYPIGYRYTLKSDVTFYPNFNHFHYDLDSNLYKYRNISTQSGIEIGNTYFEFESGIPESVINKFTKFLNEAYKDMSFEFTPTKAFVMTENTYSNHSIAYGVTHNVYRTSSTNLASYITIDLKYDTGGSYVVKNEVQQQLVKNEIDENAVLHELAHTWDSYYSYQTGKSLHDQEDIKKFFNEMVSNGSVNPSYSEKTNDGGANVEWFAGMVTNYYWHVLKRNDEKPYYALKTINRVNGFNQTKKMTAAEKEKWKKIMEKYIKKTNSFPVNKTKSSTAKTVNIMDENNKNITNKIVNKNLCNESKLYYTKISRDNIRYVINSKNLTITKGNGIELKYKTSNTNLKKDYKIVLTLYDKNNTSNKAKVTFVNTKDCNAYDIEKSNVEKIPGQSSSKEEIKPEPVVRIGNTVLEKDKDYSLSYSNDVEKGMGQVTISGVGKYYGKKVVSYKIVKNKDETRNTVGAAKVLINIPQVLKDGTCTTSEQVVGFKEISGKGISEIQYKTDNVSNWTKLGDGNNKTEIRISIKKPHSKMWFRIIDSYNNTKEFGPYTSNIKENCNATQPRTNNNQQNNNVQPKANNNNQNKITQTNSIKIIGIDKNGCKNRGVTFKFDSSGDNGASIKKIEISKDGKLWKRSERCTINGKVATCKITVIYNSLYYRVTTTNNHYQVFGKYCTK